MWRVTGLRLLMKTADAFRGTRLRNSSFARSAKQLLERALIADDKTIWIEVNGQRMEVWAQEKWRMYLLLGGGFDSYLTQCFREAVRPGSIVIDIGAHIGYYTLLAAACCRPGGMVYAFEPEPRNYSLLIGNVRANGHSNVKALQKAASDGPGTTVLFRDQAHTGIHSLYPTESEKSVRQQVAVERVALDDCLDIAAADVIKIDVEGSEPFALRGMRRLISRSPKLKLFIELNPIALQSAGVAPQEFLAQLHDLGFRQIFLLDEKRQRMEPFPVYRAEAVDEGQGAENLLCVKC